jgi:hypothetical protein
MQNMHAQYALILLHAPALRCITRRIQGSVQFHDCLHGSRAKRGTRTAIIEAKLIQQLAMRRQVPVYTIFLDLQKAYDAIDRGRTLEILEGYGVGPSARRLLKHFWDHQQVAGCKTERILWGGFWSYPWCRGVSSPLQSSMLLRMQ